MRSEVWSSPGIRDNSPLSAAGEQRAGSGLFV